MASIVIPRGDEMSDAIKEQLMDDLMKHPVRKLSPAERDLYGRAIVRAVTFIPAFRDALALMRPYMDATAPTAYTDPHARVALGYWFFYVLDVSQRASVLLHECMHVLNNHFQRRMEITTLRSNPQLFNLAGDFEINTVLHGVRFVDLSEGQLPDRAPNNYPPFKTMEFYAELLARDVKQAKDNCPACKQDKKDQEAAEKKAAEKANDPGGDEKSDEKGDQPTPGEKGDSSDEGGDTDGEGSEGGQGEGAGDGQGQPSQGSGAGAPGHTCGKGEGHSHGQGQGSGDGDSVETQEGKSWECGNSDEESEAAADEAGIQRASDVEVTIAKQNTAARIIDEKNSGGRGTGANDAFWDAILKHLTPPTVDWRKILRRIVASSVDSITKGRSDYSYRRVSRRLQSPSFVFPGMLTYLPKLTLAVDTSGSMGNEDFQKALNEIEGILKEVARGKESVSLFSVDTKVSGVRPVTSVTKLRLEGGGGTIMAVAWQYVKTLGKKIPDILILVTDGFIDWDDVETEVRTSKFKSVICVTQKGGYASAPDSLKRLIPVLDISKDS